MLHIFDCDGVLVDSELIALETLSALMTGFGHPMSAAACRDAFMGQHIDDIVRGIEARLGRPLPNEGPRMRALMLARFERELKPVAGVADALGKLDGPRCVASSSDRGRVRLTLDLTGLSGFFGDHIFSGVDVARGKPAPDLFLHAASTMGVLPGDCIVIEDSVMGVEAGVAAGMLVVGFTGAAHTDPGHAARLQAAGARSIVQAMSDLPAALGRVGSADRRTRR